MRELARRTVRRFEHAANASVLARSSYHFEGRRGLVRRSDWTIGILRGRTPLSLDPFDAGNPVLTRHDVTDVPAAFVADPFMLRVPTGWAMFFEVFNRASGRGEIGGAESRDGVHWEYTQRVLVEPFHLSYPYVFDWQGDHYMIPESAETEEVRLYVADPFPDRWTFVRTLLRGPLFDASVFQWDGRWWMYCGTSPNLRHDYLRLFYAPDLLGPWHEHPGSPVVRADPRHARPGGRVLTGKHGPVRFAQDCHRRYGHKVHAFEVTELTPVTYRERILASEVLAPAKKGWNSVGMHTLDAHRAGPGLWIAAVDGRGPP
jgi:beta-xylosidase